MDRSENTEKTTRENTMRRAVHLRDAVLQKSVERHDSVADLARVLDMSVGHFYRIKKDPTRLGGLSLQRIESLARYVGWPKVQVMVAVGWLREAEVTEVLSPAATVRAALGRLAHSGLANALTTPIERAPPDHQALMAKLLIAAEGTAAR